MSEALRLELKQIVEDELSSIVQGAAQDLARYADAISIDMMRFVAQKNTDGIAELHAQVDMLAEIHRIQADHAQWRAVQSIITAITRAAIAGALA